MSHRNTCANTDCDSGDNRFVDITSDTTAGGQDWMRFWGASLCGMCYGRYNYSGSMERIFNVPLAPYERHCSNKNCTRTDEDCRFMRINGRSNAGGQDWTSLINMILCQSCYILYWDQGRLTRTLNTVCLLPSEKHCTYAKCTHPDRGRNFYKINGNSTAGGQDWTSIKNNILCGACYMAYRCNGTLFRNRRVFCVAPALHEQHCSFAGCPTPHVSKRFRKMNGHCTAGEQDWKPLENIIICDACFKYYKQNGTLSRKRKASDIEKDVDLIVT